MKKIIILLIINITTFQLLAQTENLLSGSGAGYNVASGNDYNTALGDSTFFESSSSSYVSAFGTFASYYANTQATTIGYKAGGAISYGVAIGVSSSGFSNETKYNTTIGHNAGFSLTSSDNYNVLIGESAGYSLTNDDVVIIGHGSGYNLDAKANIFLGHNIGYNATEEGNTIVGNATTDYGNGSAGASLTTGGYNTLLGASAGSSLTTSNYNTFLGTGAGGLTETAEPNTFIGGLAGYNTGKNGTSTTANYNTFVGYKAGYTNEGGRYNTIVGANADVADANLDWIVQVGVNSVVHSDAVTLLGYGSVGEGYGATGVGNEISVGGDYSIGLGYQTTISTAADNSISFGYQSSMIGERSIGIGYLADVQGDTSVAIGSDIVVTGNNATVLGVENTVSSSNAMAIGYNISIANDNQINIGNDAVMSISGIVNWTTTSDGRLKTNVQEDIPGLDFIMKLRPVSYELRVTSSELSVTRYTGFIAQEVEQAAFEINYDFSGIDKPTNANDRYGLRYGQFTVPLVKATQELSATIQTTKQAISKTKKQTTDIDELLNEAKALLSELEN